MVTYCEATALHVLSEKPHHMQLLARICTLKIFSCKPGPLRLGVLPEVSSPGFLLEGHLLQIYIQNM